mgnify:CR=1 FL=1
MATYTLPRDAYELLVEVFGEKSKAEVFARALERSIQAIEERADEVIVEKKAHVKIELKEELRQELVTRELFEERFKMIEQRFNVVDEKFKSLNFKLNIFIAIALLALTLANPTFATLVGKLFSLP